MNNPSSIEASKVAYRALGADIGVEIRNIDPGTVDETSFADVYRLFLKFKVIVFRSANVMPGDQIRFAQRFGEVQVHVMNQYHASEYPELYTLSNLDKSGNPSGKHPDRGTLAWHTDGSWMARTGLATFMYAEKVPPPGSGGETHFADMYGAWDRLSGDMQQRLAEMRAVHNLDFSRTRRHGHEPMTAAQRAEVPPVDHPIKRRHPDTGRFTVFLGDHAEYIKNMDYESGRRLIDDLNAEIIHEDLIYRHHWEPGDFVVWDNRAVLHRATEYDTGRHARVIRRCTVIGGAPFD